MAYDRHAEAGPGGLLDGSDRGARAGRRTLTMGLPARPQPAPAAVPREGGDPVLQDAYQRQMFDAAVRPDLAPGSQRPEALLVEDDEAPASGQMTKREFLAMLRMAVEQSCASVLGPGWAAKECPDIAAFFAGQTRASAGGVERLIRRYIGGKRGSGAEYIAAVCARLRPAVSRWARGENLDWAPGSSGLPAALEAETGGGDSDGGGALRTQLIETGSGTVPIELGGGRPLDAAVGARMAAAMGAPQAAFADVTVHDGDGAGRVPSRIGADALAIGRHIAFAPGEYRPGTVDGDGLIAHELRHVAQQHGGALESGARIGRGGGAVEQDADAGAQAAMGALHRGRPAAELGAAPAAPVQVAAGNRPEEHDEKISEPPRSLAPVWTTTPDVDLSTVTVRQVSQMLERVWKLVHFDDLVLSLMKCVQGHKSDKIDEHLFGRMCKYLREFAQKIAKNRKRDEITEDNRPGQYTDTIDTPVIEMVLELINLLNTVAADNKWAFPLAEVIPNYTQAAMTSLSSTKTPIEVHFDPSDDSLFLDEYNRVHSLMHLEYMLREHKDLFRRCVKGQGEGPPQLTKFSHRDLVRLLRYPKLRVQVQQILSEELPEEGQYVCPSADTQLGLRKIAAIYKKQEGGQAYALGDGTRCWELVKERMKKCGDGWMLNTRFHIDMKTDHNTFIRIQEGLSGGHDLTLEEIIFLPASGNCMATCGTQLDLLVQKMGLWPASRGHGPNEHLRRALQEAFKGDRIRLLPDDGSPDKL